MEPDYKRAFGELKSFVENFSLEDVMRGKLPIDSQAAELLKEKPKSKSKATKEKE